MSKEAPKTATPKAETAEQAPALVSGPITLEEAKAHLVKVLGLHTTVTDDVIRASVAQIA